MSNNVVLMIDGKLINGSRGLSVYLRSILDSINLLPEDDCFQVFLLVPKGVDVSFVGSGIKVVSVSPFYYVIWEQIVLPYYALKLKPNIIWHPANTLSIPILFCNIKMLVTVHDLMFKKVWFGATIRQRVGNLYRLITSFGWKYATKITVVSEATQEELMLQCGLTSTLLPNAGFKLKEYNACMHHITMLALVSKQYFLHVGGTGPNKNTIRVVKSFLQSKAFKMGFKIVLVGSSKSDFAKLLDDNGIKSDLRQIVITGFVTDDVLSSLYQFSLALLFPSLAEGFGLPLIEARSLKIPIISSNLSPMKELAGSASVLVDPYNEQELAAALDEFVKHSEDYSIKLKESYQQVTSEFSIETNAERISLLLKDITQ